MSEVAQFIADFKKSKVYYDIINDNKIEVIMLFLTGSTLLKTSDSNSDYDICVLVKEKPTESLSTLFKVYSRPGSYFIYYKKQQKIAQWIYNDINDITNITSTPLDNIGWVQFKYISENYIIYKNPKYLNFINDLLQRKQEISTYALYLFVKSALNYIQENDSVGDLVHIRRNKNKPVKLFGHICWAADLLQNKFPNEDLIKSIKRTFAEHLTEEQLSYIKNSMNFLEQFLINPNLDIKKPNINI